MIHQVEKSPNSIMRLLNNSHIKYLIIIILAVLAAPILVWAQTDEEYELDSVQIKHFEKEASYTYQLFFESILNIIDNRIPFEDRYLSRSLIIDLFSNSKSGIFDIIDTEKPEYYNPSDYGFKLLEAERDLPILYKKYKYSDDFSFSEKPNRGTFESDGTKAFKIYGGELFVFEKLINTVFIDKSIAYDRTYNAVENGLLKSILFRIAHNIDNTYYLSIERIKIVDPKDANYDYDDIVERITNNGIQWSNHAEEDYIDELIAEAGLIGIDLIPRLPSVVSRDSIIDIPTSIRIDSSTMIEKPISYSGVKLIDLLIPGTGHMKYGSSRGVRITKTILYSGVFLFSGGFSYYHNVRSNEYSDQHIDAFTFRNSQIALRKANRHEKISFISGSVAALTFIANATHLLINNSIQSKRIKEAKRDMSINASIKPGFVGSFDEGVSIYLTLNF